MDSKTSKTAPVPKKTTNKTKAIKKARQLAKLHKTGDPRKKHRTFTQTRFHRPKTLRLARKPSYLKSVRAVAALTEKNNKFEKWNVLKQPLATEKAMKKVEDENTMVFLVDQRATKSQIKEAFFQIHKAKVRKVNTVVRSDGKKKAFIKLSSENDSLKLANSIGII